MKRTFFLLTLVFLLLIQVGAAANKKRVAVLDFDFSGVQRWWGGYNWDIGAGLADVVVKDLVRSGEYSVIERQEINSILAEQEFSQSDRVDPSSAARIGSVLGVDAIIVGSITQFGTEKEEKSFGGFGGSWGGFGGGKVGTSEGKAVVAVDARIIDVETGEILAVADGKAESSRSGLILGGFGGGGGSRGGGSIDMNSSDFRDTILGEATHEAAAQVAEELAQAEARIPVRKKPVRGLVAYADAGLVILNVGTIHGVAVGDELSVERVEHVVKDPASGKVLREITAQVATIRVTQVDAESAEAQIVSGQGIEIGDLVKN